MSDWINEEEIQARKEAPISLNWILLMNYYRQRIVSFDKSEKGEKGEKQNSNQIHWIDYLKLKSEKK